jgi:hypothetical protein
MGWIDTYGTYTTNAGAGWAAVDASFSWVPQAGGSLKAVPLNYDATKLGAKDGLGQIVPARINGITAGNYNVTMSVRFGKPDPNDPKKTIYDIQQSSMKLVTVK